MVNVLCKFFQWIFYLSASFFENKILRAANIVVYHLNDMSKVKDNKFYDKFIHIPPPLSSRFFRNKPERNVKKGNKKLTLGFCGRCDPDKGIEDTFKGLELFKRKYSGIDFEFILIGDGTEAHRMKRKYPSMNITITGYVNDVIPYLDKLDGFILSSHQETISLSSLEAYARGVTIFSVPIGYLSESSSQVNNFYLFKTKEQLADLIYNKLVLGDENAGNKLMNHMNDFVISYSYLYSFVMEKISGSSK